MGVAIVVWFIIAKEHLGPMENIAANNVVIMLLVLLIVKGELNETNKKNFYNC